MAAGLVDSERARDVADVLDELVRRDATSAHSYATTRLTRSARPSARDLSDAVHLIAMLHADRPGLLDIAHERLGDGPAADWAARAARAFAGERAFITRLIVAAGPVPSTPAQAGTEAAVVAQRQALEHLARSDRAGCPLGGAIGFVLDWPAVRAVLDCAAERFGTAGRESGLPTHEQTLDMLRGLDLEPRSQRAICFGAEQVFVQHRGLWDLLEARSSARG